MVDCFTDNYIILPYRFKYVLIFEQCLLIKTTLIYKEFLKRIGFWIIIFH
jgi:hypothetical protein